MNKRAIGCFIIILMGLTIPAFTQGHGDPFKIAFQDSMAGWPQVCYNPSADEYLVVWEDYRNGHSDIYGQFVKGNGDLKGDNFPIISRPGHQFWPRLDFDKSHGKFLIVFEDWKDPENGDIRGVFLREDGSFHDAPTAEADHTFGICTHKAKIYTCAVAFNFYRGVYLVVWGDFRNDPNGTSYTGADVFGQLIGAGGELLPPPTPADAGTNFAIAANPQYDESVADVTFNATTDEFFVAYGTTLGIVFGQRVSYLGELITPNGIKLPVNTGVGVPMAISEPFRNGPDCFQARVQANNETPFALSKPTTLGGWSECEVVWKGAFFPERKDNDVWGQRIAFFWTNDRYVAKYVDLNGDTSSTTRSNHPISWQNDWVGAPEIAYSWKDNEYLVGWGDPRDYGWIAEDLYCQRLWVNRLDQKMVFLADDRVHTVTHTENIPLVVSSDKYEGSLVGIAHGSKNNQFLIAYSYYDPMKPGKYGVMGMLVNGSKPTVVEPQHRLPESFRITSNYPNPFNQQTRIEFQLPQTESIRVMVHDLVGREVSVLFDGIKTAGRHSVVWDGTESSGNDAPTGIYFITFSSASKVMTHKVALVR